MAVNLMTKTDFADVMGVDRAQPTRWGQLGMPVLPDGRVDAVIAAKWVRAFTDGAQRRTRSNGARAGRASAAVRHVEAGDALARTALRLAVHMVPSLVEAIAAEARLSTAKAQAVFDISLRQAPRIEAAVSELMQVPSDPEAEPFERVTHPLPLLLVGA